MKMSMRRPFTAAPWSSTTYLPLTRGPRMRMRDPMGSTRGSAATVPRRTSPPVAVMPRRQYAVAVIVMWRTGRRALASADAVQAKSASSASARTANEASLPRVTVIALPEDAHAVAREHLDREDDGRDPERHYRHGRRQRHGERNDC